MTRRHDVRAWCKNVEAGAEVGERRSFVSRRRRAHRDGARFTRRRHRARTHVGVASSNHERDSVGDAARNCKVEGCRARTAETHVRNRRDSGLVMADDPVDARDDVGSAARPGAAHHPHRHDERGRCDAVVGASDRAGDVGSVAMTVVRALSVSNRGETCRDSTCQLAMRRTNPGVDDVHGHTRTRLRARVAAVERQTSLIDAVKTPREWHDTAART